ncbi:hypothetical protein K435DRAFT_791642 [Dendrothele bispora CBS 962.96]|uniref:Uncharacterized protein n=1 Tax=Dendrothele bispora (strain CBS 962.96) TaxID=1314807 RepID=A0A4S8MM42_DENBC|nr:hypothetical protein K435DRAFT_791642 [Dendrothele bispora CBS 962.96]
MNIIMENEYKYWYTTNARLAGFTALVWDHILTFSSEVVLVLSSTPSDYLKFDVLGRVCMETNPEWREKASLDTVLDTYLSPTLSWNRGIFRTLAGPMMFNHANVSVLLDIVAMMMLIRSYYPSSISGSRIFALYYHNQKIVVYGVASLLAVQIAVNSWLLTHGTGVEHDFVKACTMIFDLPVWNYSAIAAITCVLVVMIKVAPDGLKNVCHQLELLLRKSTQKRRTRKDGDHDVSTLICASPVSPNSPNPPYRHTLDDADPNFRHPDPVLSPKDPEAGSVMHIEDASNRDDYLMVPTSGTGPSSRKIPASYLPPFTGYKSEWH